MFSEQKVPSNREGRAALIQKYKDMVFEGKKTSEILKELNMSRSSIYKALRDNGDWFRAKPRKTTAINLMNQVKHRLKQGKPLIEACAEVGVMPKRYSHWVHKYDKWNGPTTTKKTTSTEKTGWAKDPTLKVQTETPNGGLLQTIASVISTVETQNRQINELTIMYGKLTHDIAEIKKLLGME